MEAAATVLGVAILLWVPIGPLVGYLVAVRGWRLRSPLTRGNDEESL